MVNFILACTVFGLLFYIFYKWATRNHDFFEKQGLRYEKPLPVIGNSAYLLTGNGLVHRLMSCYNMFPDEKVFGIFDFQQIMYFIRSPELVKQLTIKDFAHFQDHEPFVDPSTDDLFGNVLFILKGKQWRDMRTSLSPLFTGSKMRTMLQLINNCTKQMVDYLHEDYKKYGIKAYPMKNLFSRYTNDVIATCAFGVECDSLRHPNNEIYKIGQELLKLTSKATIIKMLFIKFLPYITRLFKMGVFSHQTREMIHKLVISTMEVRRREGIVRPDLLQQLMKLKDGQLSIPQEQDPNEDGSTIGDVKKAWSDIELIAQSFQFYLAGFDTSSTALTYIAYELAVNSDVQSKLITEVDEIHDNLDGRALTYETLSEMKYMDMVISEVLRKWPPLVVLDRKCVKKYTYEDEDGLKFTIDEGSILCIPAYAFHMDPKYFPNPEKFDPERFSDENKANINLNAYLPFGIGPRSCIGIRFALMEIKAFLFHFLRNFRFAVGRETQVPLKLQKSLFGLIPEKDITLNIEPKIKS